MIPFNECNTCSGTCNPVPVVYAHLSFFYFCNQIIARLDGKSYRWSQVGKLNQGRIGNNAFYLSGHFLVVGGRISALTEKCTYKNDKMDCHSQYPKLSSMYSQTPELITVSDDYCD